MVIVPPKPAAKARGIRTLLLLMPAEAAIPIAIGIITAVVPVLLNTADSPAVVIKTPSKISIGLPFAKPTTKLPILPAAPVSNRAAPTTNIPPKRTTLESAKPAIACLGVRTPVKFRATGAQRAVIAKGINSVIKKKATKAKIIRV